jgi:NAD+ synthase
LTAVPTDGLFGDERCDEDQLGASYDELEWAMNIVDEEAEISTFSERQKEVLKIYKRLNRINQHKMNPIPVCVIPDSLKM